MFYKENVSIIEPRLSANLFRGRHAKFRVAPPNGSEMVVLFK